MLHNNGVKHNRDVNEATLEGVITSKDLYYTQTRDLRPIVKFDIMTEELLLSEVSPTYHHIACFGEWANVVSDNFAQGRRIRLRGVIRYYNFWKDGVKESRMRIAIDERAGDFVEFFEEQ